MHASYQKKNRSCARGSTVKLLCRTLLLLTVFQFLPGCTGPVGLNEPLEQWTPETAGHVAPQMEADRSTELLVLVGFSGGGTRAAAFSYGVLQELAQTSVRTVRGPRTLLDEVDVISSVSGGSFTAAYYGLYGQGLFEDFEQKFLRKNVEGDLLGRCFRPDYFFRLWAPSFGKSDIADTYYSKYLYDGATFKDLKRPGAPLIVINATDLATGLRFSFNNPYFDQICSDFDNYPISRAVAASSAVPVLFTPIILENYAGTCGYQMPSMIVDASQDASLMSGRLQAQSLQGYQDAEHHPWLHLVDGGIADNLGLRAFYEGVLLTGDPRRALAGMGHPNARRILMISVNSHARHEAKWPLKPKSPSLVKMLGSVSDVQMNRYGLDTIDIVQYSYKTWAQRLSTSGRPVTFDFVEVGFDNVQDVEERHSLDMIGTNFHLSDEKIDLLITAARQVVRESPSLKKFLSRP